MAKNPARKPIRQGALISVDDAVSQARIKSEARFGRPDVPSFVQVAAEHFARLNHVTELEALATLVEEHGSFERLVAATRNKRNLQQRKASKAEALAAEQKLKSQLPRSPHQKAMDKCQQEKFVWIIPSGAPGLGKKA